jgi:ketosteroid isomerase-like protein
LRIREWLAALLLASSLVSPLFAQAPSPSLPDAERAFADALMHHDRGAFVALLAPDAESSLPAPTRGPEAIANAWLPFLIDPGTTMVLTSTDVIVATSGDAGSSTGGFAIRGRTSNGVKTVPAGTYAIMWRVIDGHWRISTLGRAGPGNGKTADRGGVGMYRFGMTRSEVTGVSACQPYTNVSQTGGLECPHYVFDGQEMNVSFFFTADHLRRIQLWFYEGTSGADARIAVRRVIDYLHRAAGGASIGGLPGVPVTPDVVMDMLNSAPPQPGGLAQFELSSPTGPQPEVWFSRVARHEHGFLVMLFADSREGH